MKLNKAAVAGVKVPKGKADVIVWDKDVAGFGLRVRAGGARVWVFRYRIGGSGSSATGSAASSGS
jgi:hypothetical protein